MTSGAAEAMIVRGEVTRANLNACNATELEAVARLLGIPHTGSKAGRVNRILDAWEVRTFLSDYADDAGAVDDLAELPRPELQRLARLAGRSPHYPKRALAAALLNWRRWARQRGGTFAREIRAELKRSERPRQMRLF